MKLFNIFRRRPARDIQQKIYMIVLYHDQGNTVELIGISEKILNHIKSNLGRDEIIITEEHCINLSKFSLMNYMVSSGSTKNKIGRLEEQ